MFLEASFGLRLFWGSDAGVYEIFTEGMPPKNAWENVIVHLIPIHQKYLGLDVCQFGIG